MGRNGSSMYAQLHASCVDMTVEPDPRVQSSAGSFNSGIPTQALLSPIAMHMGPGAPVSRHAPHHGCRGSGMPAAPVLHCSTRDNRFIRAAWQPGNRVSHVELACVYRNFEATIWSSTLSFLPPFSSATCQQLLPYAAAITWNDSHRPTASFSAAICAASYLVQTNSRERPRHRRSAAERRPPYGHRHTPSVQ